MWSKRIEVITNVALFAAAISIFAVNIVPRFQPKPVAPGRYAAGDRIAETAQLKFDGKATVILNTASTCRYCTASMDFYKRLLATGVRTVAVTPEPIEKNDTYLKEHGITPVAILSVSENGLKFRTTPSLVVVNAQGIVKGAWHGKQSAAGEEEILRAIR